jgi:hypothetical protein
MTVKNMQGPFNFDNKEVYFDSVKGEFWDPSQHVYLDHEIGLALIDLYFGHHKAPLEVKKNTSKVKKNLLKSLMKKHPEKQKTN